MRRAPVSSLRCFLVSLFRHALILSFAFTLIFPLTVRAQPAPLHLVNPFVGTSAHGHTFPGATTPFGMVQLSPDTRVEGWDACAGYHYSDSTILGFSHMHLSGTGIADYGDILFLPTIGSPRIRTSQKFSHSSEKASPGYYRVLLEDDNILAEFTASPRVGVHRYTFPTSTQANIVIDLKHGLGPDRVLESWLEFVSDTEISGFRKSAGWADSQHVYFVAQFSKPFYRFGRVMREGDQSPRTLRETDLRAFVQFATTAGERIMVKVGISSVGVEGARKNLSEVPHWNFERAVQQAEELWRNELKKIEIEGGTLQQQRTFYTALYHTMIAPNLAGDVDGKYRGMDGSIRTAGDFDLYTVFSLWDTFRSQHPLLTMLDKKRTSDFVRSLLAKYDESGVLPVWELASNETWTMIGYHSIPVIVDAYVKGVKGFDIQKAFAAMKQSAMRDTFGLDLYRRFGFIPGDFEGESVSKTLEYSYDDWCIAELARLLGKSDDARIFSERSQFYRNLYDPGTGFMRPRINGHWLEPFDPRAVTVHYTEANAWQYSFFAPHDPLGLLGLVGGRDLLERRLDSLFFTSSAMTGRNQADITGMIGQYAHGNEPSHHLAYLYQYTSSPWKTEHLVRQILDSLYTDMPDGLCGNDDCGQMSAWYVFNALGLYPVVPGTRDYHLGSPLFGRALVHLENGKTFTLQTRGKGGYLQDISINGRRHERRTLSHDDVVSGSLVEITLGESPDSDWSRLATTPAPDALIPPITTAPFFVSPGKSFPDSITFEIRSTTPGSRILYKASKKKSSEFVPYAGPVTLTESAVIQAYAEKEGYSPGKVIEAEFVKARPVGTIALKSAFSAQYAAGGDQALVDGARGGRNFRLGAWQGYEGIDLEAVLDLGEVKDFQSVGLSCLQDETSWIFFPQFVEFSFSSDGTSFSDPVLVKNDIPAERRGEILKEFSVNGPHRARFIRVRAKSIGVCPPWHKGAGGKAWIFADEIVVREEEG